MTSRVILEAMSINGTGHLWSLDLPHPFRPELHKETAAAVPTACRDRWTYVRGSSRRRLASLVSTLTEIDMFVHDSLHTSRNIRFELRTVWPALQRGDLVLVDDVDNQAFRDFVREVGNPPSIVLRSADGPCLFGAIQKVGVANNGRIPLPPLVRRVTLWRRAWRLSRARCRRHRNRLSDATATVHGHLNDRGPGHACNPTAGRAPSGCGAQCAQDTEPRKIRLAPRRPVDQSSSHTSTQAGRAG